MAVCYVAALSTERSTADYNVETGFVNAAINAWARLNLASVVDEMNEKVSGVRAPLAPRR